MSRDMEQKIEEILRDQSHGASFLAREALATMKVAAARSEAGGGDCFVREMARLGTRLIALRPSMAAPICNGVVRAFDAISRIAEAAPGVRNLKASACHAVEEVLARSEENARKTIGHVSRAIPENATLLTHSYSETCLRALLAAEVKGVRVYTTESRPLCEGRTMAEKLGEGGVDVTLITDAEAGCFMREVQLVLVGADSVLSDGAVINKTGTHLIALAARESDVPFHVACDSWKFRLEEGIPELEEKSPDEVVERASGIKARNVYFDVTPPELIASLLTEEGEVMPKGVWKRCEKWRKVLQRMRALATG